MLAFLARRAWSKSASSARGTWLVRGPADVAPTMEWLAEGLLVGALKGQLRCSPTQSSTRSTREHFPATSVASSSAKP